MRRLFVLALALLTLPPAADAASPWEWRAYPNGERRIAFDLAQDHLLVAFPGDEPPAGWEKVVEKAAPGAVVAEVSPLLPGRHRLCVEGVDADGLRDVADALVEMGVVTGAWPALERNGGVAFVDERVAVRFEGRPPLAALAKLGIRLVERTRLPGTWAAVAADGDAIGAAWALKRRPEVRWAEPDLIRHVKPLSVPNDPDVGRQWHLANDDGAGSIDAATAWDRTYGDPSVVIGIFDTGIDMDHPDLLPAIVGGFDAAGGDDNPEAECGAEQDGLGPARSCPANRPFRESHSTAVAGVAAARGDNGILGAGVCPQCSLFPVRLLGGGGGLRSLSNSVAFQRATDEGVDVVNNSWGPGLTRFFPLSESERETFERITTEGRDGKGVVLVFAAGNDYFTPATANPYAANPGVITVAASTRKDDFACYSNYGDVIAVAAPSQGCFDGEPGIATTDYAGNEGYGGGDFTTGFSGTSAASPVVAGLAGLVLSANPELTAQQVRLILQASADKIVADKNPWQQQLGVNLVEEFAYDEHGFSKGFGYGRINAARAVAMALDAPPSVGGVCGEDCARCVEGRCAPECAADADCPGAARCLDLPDGGKGCRIPHPAPTAAGQPCAEDCDRCITTVDSQFDDARICTVNCETDEDCPFGFDCRTLSAAAGKACIPGNAECGARWGEVRCQSDVRVQGNGQDFCSCDCVPGEPGACPDGFVCANVACERTRQGIFCDAVDSPRQANYLPQCVPDPNFRRPCGEHRECPVGLFCIDGTCAPDKAPGGCDVCAACGEDGDCRDGETCADLPRGRFCVAPCGADGACPGDTECSDLPGPVGRMCVNPDWRRKGYCPRAYRCGVEGRCFEDGDCDEVACVENQCAARQAEPDAAVPAPDAAVAEPDAAVAEPDAAVAEPDAGTNEDDESSKKSSGGCQVAPIGPLPLLAIGLIGLLRRRRGR